MILSFTFYKSNIYKKTKYVLKKIWKKLQEPFEHITVLATKQNC